MDASPKKGACGTTAAVESPAETAKAYYIMENRAGGMRDMRRRR